MEPVLYSKFRHKALGISHAEHQKYLKVTMMVLSWLLFKSTGRDDSLVPIGVLIDQVNMILEPKTEQERLALAFIAGNEYARPLVDPQRNSVYQNIMRFVHDKLQLEYGNKDIPIEEWILAVKSEPTLRAATAYSEETELGASVEIVSNT